MWPASEKRRMHRTFWWNGLNGRNHLQIAVPEGRIITKWLLKEHGVRPCSRFIEWGRMAGSCEYGNEPLTYAKRRK
jgi:hypothetical protein